MGKYDDLRSSVTKPTSQRTASNIEAYRAALLPSSEQEDKGSKYDDLRNPQKYLSQKKAEENDRAKTVLKDTLESVMRPTPEVKKTVDFKAEMAKNQTPKKNAADFSKDMAKKETLSGKLPAASLLVGDNNKKLQSTLNGKLPAASLLTRTGGGPANASQLNNKDIWDRIDDFNAFTDRMKSAATFGGTELVDRIYTKLGPEEANQDMREKLERAENVKGGMIADVAGSLVSGKLSYDLGGKLVAPLIKNAPKAIQKLVTGATAGAAWEAPKQFNEELGERYGGEQQSLGERAANTGVSAAVGGAGDLALSALGKAGSALLNRYIKRASNVEVMPPVQNGPVLALPEGRGTIRQSQAAGRSQLDANGDVIINPTDWTPEPLGLPQADILPPTTARKGTKPGLNTILEQMKPIVDERMTPPLENPNELAKWIQYHFGGDVSLNEIRALGYEEMRLLGEEIRKRLTVEATARQVAKELGYDYDTLLSPKTVDKDLVSKARQTQEARETYGLGNKVRSSLDRYKPFVGQAAAPETIVARKGATVKPTSEPVIRDPRKLTREQEIHNRSLQTGELTQEDIDFLLSPEYNPNNLMPESTLQESAYVKPKAEVKPFKPKNNTTPELEVAATLEAPIKAAPKEPEPKVKGERGFTQTLKASEKTPEALKTKLSNAYEPITNQKTVDQANARLAKDVDDATNMVLSAKKFDAEKSVTAQRLIDHYNKIGNYEMSVNIADKIATEATKAGQFIQSLSVYNRLTPEGVLIHAQRIAKRINETGSKIGKEAVVTEKMAEDIVAIAGVTQKMTGVKDLSNTVIDILERAKSGEKLNAADASTLEKFVNESKQFIKETAKKENPAKAPKTPKDKRVRDNLVSFLDAQEEAAKARLRAKGIRISSTPVDIWADYAVIGAAKMGKGTVKLVDWSEAMVKDFGEDIRPHLTNLYNRSVEAFELSSQKVTRSTISEAEKLTNKVIKTKELSETEAQSLIALAQKVSGLSGEAKRTASQDLQYILQQLDKPSFEKKLSSAQTIAQLLNPKTQVRNVLGNELFYRIERLNKLAATPIDIARSKVFGGDRYVTFRNYNQGQFWKNFMEGAKAGWKGVNINGLETQFDLVGLTFRSNYNPLKYLEKALGASLRGFDNAAYMRAYNDTMGELATLDALNKGLKPSKEYTKTFISKADENIQQIADTYGKYVTFQDNNLISQGLTKFKKGLNFGKDFGIGDLVLKYPKTPGALLMRALEYSPAGFLRSAKIAVEPLLKNGVEANPAEVTQALTRAIIGTFGLSGLGYYFMDKGVLSGQMNKDRDIRALESAAGQGQYQVNLSALYRFAESGFDLKSVDLQEGDLLYNYDWMQPVSVAVSMGANINKNLKEGASGEKIASGLAGAAFNSVAGGINTLTEQSVLQGIQRTASGYPGQTVTDKIVDIVSDVPASFIPTILNQVKQYTDNNKRETYDPSKVDVAMNKAQARIPGLAGKLPKKYDSLGNEQKHYQDNNAVNVFLNPGFPSRYTLSPEAKMIVELIAETGDESLAPRVPLKSLKGTKLTGEQFSRLSQIQGEITKNLLSKIKTDIPTNAKERKVDKSLDKAGKKAREQLLKEFPGLTK